MDFFSYQVIYIIPSFKKTKTGMTKDILIILLMILLSHKFILSILEQHKKIEKMDNTYASPEMKDELMQFIMNAQSNSASPSVPVSAGVSEVSPASNLAASSFGPESTDMSKYFAMKSSDALKNLQNTMTTTTLKAEAPGSVYAPVPEASVPTPMSGGDLLLLKRTEDKVMNGEPFFGSVVPFGDDVSFAVV